MSRIKRILKKSITIMLIKKIIDFIKLWFRYVFAKNELKNKSLKLNVMSITDTINYIMKNKCSVIRFGDGEFMYINNKPIIYQKIDKGLVTKLQECLNNRNENILIAIPEPLHSCDNLVRKSKWHWTYRIAKDFDIYSKLDSTYNYGNAFISRPYIVYKNKDNSKKIFEMLKNLWSERNVLIVEGEYSRSGVGNDLFNNTKKVSRIICPSKDAYSYYTEILDVVKGNAKDYDLILIALGPTAKPLVLDLEKAGIWAIDIGHVDSEYEWFLRKVKSRVQFASKHTAEQLDNNIGECLDEYYLSSIIAKIGEKNE